MTTYFLLLNTFYKYFFSNYSRERKVMIIDNPYSSLNFFSDSNMTIPQNMEKMFVCEKTYINPIFVYEKYT